jgi:uncharacterized protein
MWGTPVLQVINETTGVNILPKLAGLWKSCRVVDNEGTKSDSAELVCIYDAGVKLPRKGEKYRILMGWKGSGVVLQGTYTVQTYSRRGDPETGHELIIKLRAGDFTEKLKGKGRKHFEDNTTFGEVIDQMAKRAGLQAETDPALKSIKLPYKLWWDQSIIDFVTEVAEEIGGTVKPAGGKLIARKRDAPNSASGKAMSPILIRYDASFSYEAEIEPRPEYGSVAASWHDAKSGRRKTVTEKTGRDGPVHTIKKQHATEDEARKAAKAAAYAMGAMSWTGTFDTYGLPAAFSGADVTLEGFGNPIDGKVKAESVTKEVTADGGFKTTVTTSAGNEKKKTG